MAPIPWAKILETTATSALPYILKKLQPTDRDKAIGKSIELFIEVFTTELRDTTPLQSAFPGYLDALTVIHRKQSLAGLPSPFAPRNPPCQIAAKPPAVGEHQSLDIGVVVNGHQQRPSLAVLGDYHRAGLFQAFNEA